MLPQQYPVNLIVEGKPCLVVGGGPVAAEKAAGLLACGAEVHVVAEQIGTEVRALPVTWEERSYNVGEVSGYRLAVAATESGATNKAVYDDGEAAGVWVNSADDPDNCSFTLPAVVRRGPLMVTVSTGGRSPALASWLKERLAVEIGPEYEVLVDLLAAEREAIREGGGSTEGRNWQKALDSDMLELIKNGQVADARERLHACLSSSSD
ncbi:MAG TPA: bifunctional precorrin-2 dehydrogenase/sirohydrochlorin ferrochelatase [Acidimicrobiales bacterium]|jgi:precorrin-2 dehydrogenase/sirohydrochlorin ferrochelatase|nr:bifunctional precorrin-2 dehydrogenase/sirohydrochlorin ferrochelatase [Acidimicrobiales bacterium]